MMPNLDMTIERLELTNFKTFPHAVIPFARRMNVFVGINGAGKTSILLALSKLLSWQARRMSSPVGSGGGSAILEQEIRSGAPDAMLKAVARWGDRTFSWTLAKTRRGGRIAVSRSDLLEMTNAVRDFRNRFPEGDFVSPEGKVLGRHKGIIRYTVGQRKGLGIAADEPMYVRRILPERNAVELARGADLFSRTAVVTDLCWTSGEAPATIRSRGSTFCRKPSSFMR